MDHVWERSLTFLAFTVTRDLDEFRESPTPLTLEINLNTTECEYPQYAPTCQPRFGTHASYWNPPMTPRVQTFKRSYLGGQILTDSQASRGVVVDRTSHVFEVTTMAVLSAYPPDTDDEPHSRPMQTRDSFTS